ncbi:hypothetical protein DKX38_026714 [Salix brachista]|uniref:Reverse transcriptase zinc-binding domain-containing protein n=1 Tax=Salix brachista TaxID=2182728 RepID=A0A5N5JC41_9ROSI|nr:hypothetical protein DKX38_026714 [Salix brachista]
MGGLAVDFFQQLLSHPNTTPPTYSDGPLYSTTINREDVDYLLSQRNLSSSLLPWKAKLADIIEEGRWSFPQVQILSQTLCSTVHFQPNPLEDDTVLWHPSSSGKFSIASAWEYLRDRRPTTKLHPQGRLSTLDRLHYLEEDKTCRLCSQEPESHNHLFFMCRFSSQVWKIIQDKAHTHWPVLTWHNLVEWTSHRFQTTKTTSNIIGALIFAATTYHIWQERNKRTFLNHATQASIVGDEIFQQIREHLMNSNGICVTNKIRTTWNFNRSSVANH